MHIDTGTHDVEVKVLSTLKWIVPLERKSEYEFKFSMLKLIKGVIGP